MDLLATFTERRNRVQGTYDQGLYDESRVDILREYQRLASGMAPPITPAGPTPVGRATVTTVDQINPAVATEAGMKAALDAPDLEFKRLEARVEALPVGPARETAKQQLKTGRERRGELAGNFTTPRRNVLIDDLKVLSNKLPR